MSGSASDARQIVDAIVQGPRFKTISEERILAHLLREDWMLLGEWDDGQSSYTVNIGLRAFSIYAPVYRLPDVRIDDIWVIVQMKTPRLQYQPIIAQWRFPNLHSAYRWLVNQ